MIFLPKRFSGFPLIELPRFGVSGRFVCVTHLVDQYGEVIPGTARLRGIAEENGGSPNLITNTGLDLIGTGNDINTCVAGTGSTAPANTDTALVAQIASTTSPISTVTSYNVSPEYGQRATTWRFAAGVATGNITELGMKYSTSLYARALVLDGVGAPTTFVVASGEALDVTYIQRIVPPAADASGSVVINSVTYGWVARPANVGSWFNCISGVYVTSGASITAYAGSIGTRAASPGGSAVGSSVVANAYSPGSKTRSYVGTLPIGAAFTTTSAAMNAQTFWQFSFDSGGVPKLSTQTLALTLSNSWDRA